MRGLRRAKSNEPAQDPSPAGAKVVSRAKAAKTREVVCTHCGGRNAVALRAMSVFCAHCNKRLILEDYNIKSYQGLAGYTTCGDVIVHKAGRVTAPIQATNLTVKGIVQGAVRVRGRVEIASTGTLTGSISAPSLTVCDGARLDAYCEIRPEPEGAPVKSAGVVADAATPPTAAAPTGKSPAVAPTPAPRTAEKAPAAPGPIKSISTRRRSASASDKLKK